MKTGAWHPVFRGGASQRLMNLVPVAVLPAGHEFLFKVLSIPKKGVLKVFKTNMCTEADNAPSGLINDSVHPVVLRSRGYPGCA